MATTWLPFHDLEEARRRLGPPPPSMTFDFYRGDPDPWPPGLHDVELYVMPYMRGAEALARVSEMRSLRALQTLTAGYDDIAHLVPEGVTLCNAAGVHDTSTAELAIGLCLASGRQIDHAARNQTHGLWAPSEGKALADQRVLLVGYGRIGAAIEQRLAGFEVASITRLARRARSGVVPVHAVEDLEQVLAHADVVILSAPHTPGTPPLMGATQLRCMTDGALLVNVGRGHLVDTNALLAELKTGRLRAALDVVDPEPLPTSHPLWAAPNLLITPHVGGASSAFAPRADRLIARQLQRFAAGAPLENVVLGQRSGDDDVTDVSQPALGE